MHFRGCNRGRGQDSIRQQPQACQDFTECWWLWQQEQPSIQAKNGKHLIELSVTVSVACYKNFHSVSLTGLIDFGVLSVSCSLQIVFSFVVHISVMIMYCMDVANQLIPVIIC
jgi:hypothetical protein